VTFSSVETGTALK